MKKIIKKLLWLDLELRKDIDDYITLLSAINHSTCRIKYISIHNPSQLELNLLCNTLIELSNKIFAFEKKESFPTIVVSGTVTEYIKEEDIHSSLLHIANNEKYAFTKNMPIIVSLENVLKNEYKQLKELIYFTGGSLFTLSKIMEIEPEITAYIQGGYAGTDIVKPETALKKFRKREAVPSWNLNLDEEATHSIIKNKKADLKFISKNVCHASIISYEDLENYSGFGINILKDYFLCNEEKWRKKAMHDVLAFMTIFSDTVVDFEKVSLVSIIKPDAITKWKSVKNSLSNIEISVDFNYIEFKETFFKLL